MNFYKTATSNIRNKILKYCWLFVSLILCQLLLTFSSWFTPVSQASPTDQTVALNPIYQPLSATNTDPVFASPAFLGVWQRTDKPVADALVRRTWIWGPQIISAILEPYAEAPSGQRQVVYLDKTRMELTNPGDTATSSYYISNGLLASELIKGQVQTGVDSFVARPAAQIGVAGDADDTSGPTYAAFGKWLAPLSVKPAGRVADFITTTLDRNGNAGTDASLADYRVATTYFVKETGHDIAQPFWDFLNSTGLVYQKSENDLKLQTQNIFSPTFYATGFPLTEPYWARVKVAGQLKDVLVQPFERRVLTYTPSNPAGFQIEMGNVGRHYYTWRYGFVPAVTSTQPPVQSDPPARSRPQAGSQTMSNFIGVNQNYKLYEDGTESDFARVSNWLRDYVRMYCIEPTPNNFGGINGSSGCGTAPNYFNYDAFYNQMQQVGVNILHTTHWSAAFSNWTGKDADLPPLTTAGSGQNPTDFLVHAQLLYQLAGLYGLNKNFPPGNLVTPDKQLKPGNVQAIENWNEPDGWWKGDGQFSKEQLYNMLVADYDGDQRRLPKAGIKTADPTMPVVMGGLSSTSLDYLYGILEYSKKNGRELPLDVINVHDYASDGTTGIPPEQAGVREKMEQVIKWRNAYAQGKQVWITEFGWDTYSKDNKHSNTWATLQNQANWILRAFLLYRAAGLEKAFVFIYNDPVANSLTTYDSSGLVSFDNGTKKPSYYYLGTMQDLIGDKVLDRQIATGRDDVMNMSFKNPAANNGTFVVWKTSGDGTELANFKLQLPTKTEGSCTANVPSNISFTPRRTSLKVDAAHQVSLTVSETPTFIECSDVTGTASSLTPDTSFASAVKDDGRILLEPADVIDTAPKTQNNSGNNLLANLVDEQNNITGNPPLNKPANAWYPLNDKDSFDLDLHASYDLTQLSWFNAGGDGEGFNIYYAEAGFYGIWKPLTTITNSGKNYNNWQSASLNQKAQFLRFIPKQGTHAKLGELVVYGRRS